MVAQVCVFEAHEAKQIETLEFGAGPSKEMGASCSKQPQAPQRVLVRHFYFILFYFIYLFIYFQRSVCFIESWKLRP